MFMSTILKQSQLQQHYNVNTLIKSVSTSSSTRESDVYLDKTVLLDAAAEALFLNQSNQVSHKKSKWHKDV